MPVNRELNLGFIHVPKTAGTTIERALGMQGKDCFFATEQWDEYRVCPQHLSHAELLPLLEPGLNLEWFTVVRNPFDRLVSEYHYMMQYGAYHPKLRNISFEDMIRFCLKYPVEYRKRNFDRHLEPQVSFINAGMHVEVFKYENLNEVFMWLQQRVPYELKFGQCMASVRERDYRSYYADPALVRIVEDVYEEDLIKFGYEF